MTWHTPEERFEQHRAGGYLASYYPQHYGVRLFRDLYEHLNPMPEDLATEMEKELARHLRRQGYGVWQN